MASKHKNKKNKKNTKLWIYILLWLLEIVFLIDYIYYNTYRRRIDGGSKVFNIKYSSLWVFILAIIAIILLGVGFRGYALFGN